METKKENRQSGKLVTGSCTDYQHINLSPRGSWHPYRAR